MPPDVPNLFYILIMVFFSFLLVALNAFFVASEFSIVKVRRTRLEELSTDRNFSVKSALICVDNLDEYLSATQLGITLVSLALGWIGEEAFFNLLAYIFPNYLSSSELVYHSIAVGFSFFFITMLHVVLGELVPKSMAIQRAEQISLSVAKPLLIFHHITKPLIKAFTGFANLILKKMGYTSIQGEAFTEAEIKLLVEDSRESGIITPSEEQIINDALIFSDKKAREIMLPLEKVEYISLTRNIQTNITTTKTKMHTRFPLVQNDFQTVIGVVHLKDVLHRCLEQKITNQTFHDVARPILYVDGDMKQDSLMKLLNSKRAHMAVVKDGTRNIGIVTMEDILEELVGEIIDEHGN